jgi:hypothetical protein
MERREIIFDSIDNNKFQEILPLRNLESQNLYHDWIHHCLYLVQLQ